MNAYEQKIEARKERLLARAEKLDKIAEARFKAAWSIQSMIPMGQPILVGHHSEKRHRRDIERIDMNMRKGFEAQEAAARARGIAAGAGSHGISSDDPEAIPKLEARIEALEGQHLTMNMVNRFLRKGDDAGIMALGFTAEQVAKLKEPDVMGVVGFASYQFQNSRSRIQRLKDRVEQLKRTAARPERETDLGAFRMLENPAENRLQLFFPGKPDAEVRTRLKRAGFRWAPSAGAWQRHLTASAIYAAQGIAKAI